MSLPTSCDVLVVGSGNAGFSAATQAVQSGARSVVLIDKCPEEWAGGNSYFTAGAYRTVHSGLEDILPIVSNVKDEQISKIELAPYTTDDFQADMQRVCSGRSDPELSKALISESNEAVKWLNGIGVRFHLSFNRQAYDVGGKIKFWGGLCLKTADGGKSLVEDHMKAAKSHGVQIHWSTALVDLVHGDGAEAVVMHNSTKYTVRCGSVILAAGGFEANSRMRAQYLGPGWDMAMVRGTPYNTGDCLELAMRSVGAQSTGNWSGCHSVAWDANADPHRGDRIASNEFTKSGYPLGLMLNVDGQRFVDEGVDLRNYTYAKFGRAILAQPEHVAFQVWDGRITPWLRAEEYREERVERITAMTIEELAEACEKKGLRNKDAFISTMEGYNAAVYANRKENPSVTWDPSIRDGLSTQSSTTKLALPKSNWALALNQGPFVAVRVTCGITFTFGGLKVDPETAQLLSAIDGAPIPGLYCVGEMMGGLFYQNYPGGSGLTSGTVFGRRAGRAAAESLSHSRRTSLRI